MQTETIQSQDNQNQSAIDNSETYSNEVVSDVLANLELTTGSDTQVDNNPTRLSPVVGTMGYITPEVNSYVTIVPSVGDGITPFDSNKEFLVDTLIEFTNKTVVNAQPVITKIGDGSSTKLVNISRGSVETSDCLVGFESNGYTVGFNKTPNPQPDIQDNNPDITEQQILTSLENSINTQNHPVFTNIPSHPESFNTSKNIVDIKSNSKPKHIPSKKKANPVPQIKEELVARDITSLVEKFGPKKTNKPKQAVLLVPANRQAVSYIEKAFSGPITEEDGVDYINVSYIGKTDLGRFLDINHQARFEHPELGPFTSVGGIWYYVKADRSNPTPGLDLEQFRYVWGERVRSMGEKIIPRNVEGFKTIIADSTWIKVLNQPKAKEDLLNCTLPFKSYYLYGSIGIKKTNAEAAWYLTAIEEIRKTIHLRASTGDDTLQPDFSKIESISAIQKKR